MYYLFCVILCIVYVYTCTVLLPPGGYPIAVNKYHIIYNNAVFIYFKKSGQGKNEHNSLSPNLLTGVCCLFIFHHYCCLPMCFLAVT